MMIENNNWKVVKFLHAVLLDIQIIYILGIFTKKKMAVIFYLRKKTTESLPHIQ